MPRPIMLGIVGDSAAGKTTLARGLVRILGEHRVTHVSGDHYVRYDRRGRAELGITPLHPDCNHIDILTQHVAHLRSGEAVLKPTYSHRTGTFGAPEYVQPREFTIVEGILAFHAPATRAAYDVRVFLDPPDDLRRGWKVQRDCSRRGYTTDEVLAELDRRDADAEAFVGVQRRHADIVIAFKPGDRGDQAHLDAQLALRPGLGHPDLTALVDPERTDGITLRASGAEQTLWVPGAIRRERGEAIQEAIWRLMPFASHLRTDRLGEFTVGTELRRSESLAITQLLLLYQLVTARAAVAVGASGARTDATPATRE